LDWIDAGRQDIRRQIEKHIDRIHEKPGRRPRYTFPVETSAAMTIVAALGYDASRSYFDYFVRRRLMPLPPKNGKRLAWSITHVIEFALLLERLRHWKPGCHDEKKTCWQLQDELELHDVVYTADELEVQALDADQMLDIVIDASSVERRAEMDGSFADRLETSDDAVEALLGESIEAPSTSQRKAFGVVLGGGKRSILRGRRRMGGAL